MQHQHHSENQHRINDSFSCRRAARPDGLILIHNANHYLMAEYSEFTGEAKWQRVALATQREVVEKWLVKNFPVRSQPQPEPVLVARKAKATSAVKPAAKTAKSK